MAGSNRRNNPERLSDDVEVAPEAGLPVVVAKDDGKGGSRGIVLLAEPAAQGRLEAEGLEGRVGDPHRLHLFRLVEAHHRNRAVVPHADGLEYPALVQVGVVEGRRLVHLVKSDSRGGVPYTHQLIRIFEWEGFQEDPVHQREDG
jgi:hypothetical protein